MWFCLEISKFSSLVSGLFDVVNLGSMEWRSGFVAEAGSRFREYWLAFVLFPPYLFWFGSCSVSILFTPSPLALVLPVQDKLVWVSIVCCLIASCIGID